MSLTHLDPAAHETPGQLLQVHADAIRMVADECIAGGGSLPFMLRVVSALETRHSDPNAEDVVLALTPAYIQRVGADHLNTTIHGLHFATNAQWIETFVGSLLTYVQERVRTLGADLTYRRTDFQSFLALPIQDLTDHQIGVIIDASGLGTFSSGVWTLPIPANLKVLRRIDPTFRGLIRLRQEETRKLIADAIAHETPYPSPSRSPSPLLSSGRAEQLSRREMFDLRAFHPSVVQAASLLFENGSAETSVREAIINFFAHVRSITGLNSDGDALVGTAFHENGSSIKLTQLRDDSERTIQRGALYFARGMVATIRNPVIHAPGGMTDLDALERLAIVSLLYRLTDNRVLPPPPE